MKSMRLIYLNLFILLKAAAIKAKTLDDGLIDYYGRAGALSLKQTGATEEEMRLAALSYAIYIKSWRKKRTQLRN